MVEFLGKQAECVDIGLHVFDGYGRYTGGDCENWINDPEHKGCVLVVKVDNCYKTPLCVYVPGRVNNLVLHSYLSSLKRKYELKYYRT